MLVNGRAWNMSVKLYDIIRQKVNNKYFKMYVAKEMVNLEDPLNKVMESEYIDDHNFNEHYQISIDEKIFN